MHKPAIYYTIIILLFLSIFKDFISFSGKMYKKIILNAFRFRTFGKKANIQYSNTLDSGRRRDKIRLKER